MYVCTNQYFHGFRSDCISIEAQEQEIQSTTNPSAAERELAQLKIVARRLRKQLAEKYEAKKKERISTGTKKNYRRIQKIFCEKFMKKYFPELPNSHSLAQFLDNPAAAQHLRNKDMMENENIVLLFLQALPEFCTKDEKDLGESTFGNARAAIRDLFYQVGQLWKKDSNFEREIHDWCRANSRTIAEYRLQGRTKANIGKRHMFFDLYLAIAKQYFHDGLLFEWAYHVLTWNLMTRGCSTSALRWTHIQTGNDSCVFVIPKSKADQEGVKLDPKHVFANTFNPYICPMYALGMYTLCLRYQHPTDIFPGGQQLSRFAKSLHRNKHSHKDIVKLLKSHGYEPSDIGVHSIRKGAGSYAMNGNLGQTPSISAICLRTGWTQGAIKDKYLKYGEAQDTYLGRVLAGYPVSGKDCVRFGELPPTFGKNVDDAVVRAAMVRAFPVTEHPDFPASAMGLFNRMLAVIVKNHYWIEHINKNITGHDHPYFTSLFYLEKWPAKLMNKLDEDPTLMTASGVPGYIRTTIELREQKELLRDIITVHLPDRDTRILDGVAKLLDDRNIASGGVSMIQVQGLLDRRFDRLEERIRGGVTTPGDEQRSQPAAGTADASAASVDVRRKGLSRWNEWRHGDGAWYAIPPKCKYPNPTSGVQTLLYQYYFGRVVDGTNNMQQIMPVHEMQSHNVPANTRADKTVDPPVRSTRATSRLSEAKQFVQFFEKNIKQKWPREAERGYRIPPRQGEVGPMFEHVLEVLKACLPSAATQPARKRRKTCQQKGWTTHLRDVRKWKREQNIIGYLNTVLVW